ncbi:MAG: hypothetical protein HQ582_29405 [Planctomycetes bacterium]|nr:hypothetical protein [Planctomycetota bacterium]
MDLTFALIQTASLAVGAAGMVVAGLSLRELKSHFERNGLQVNLSQVMIASTGGTGRLAPSESGYAVYMWTNETWVMETDFSQPGYETIGPGISGSYEGQLVRKEAVLK